MSQKNKILCSKTIAVNKYILTALFTCVSFITNTIALEIDSFSIKNVLKAVECMLVDFYNLNSFDFIYPTCKKTIK